MGLITTTLCLIPALCQRYIKEKKSHLVPYKDSKPSQGWLENPQEPDSTKKVVLSTVAAVQEMEDTLEETMTGCRSAMETQ